MRQCFTRAVSAMIALLLITSMVFSGAFVTVANAANTLDYSYIPSEANAWHYIRYKGSDSETSRCTYHTVSGKEAFCVHMRKNNPTGASSAISASKLLPGTAQTEAALVLYWIQNEEHEAAGLGLSANKKYVFKQVSVWRIQDKHGVYDALGWTDAIVDPDDLGISKSKQLSIIDALIKRANTEADKYTTSGTTVYRKDSDLNDGDIDFQEVAIIGTPVRKQGYLEIQKTSTGPQISSGNKCYDLEGVTYSVYASEADAKADGNRIVNIVLDKNGYGKSGLLDTGTYYLKETNAGTGFYLDEQIRTVTITFSNAPDTVRVNVQDKPKNDPLGISLYKWDKEVNASGLSLGTASLEGAEFTVYYYDGYYSEAELKGKTPLKTWILATKNENGNYVAKYENAYKVSGDDIYMLNGNPVLPLGTYEIFESKAPQGYLINADTYLYDAVNNTIAKGNQHYIAQVTENSGKVELQGGNTYTYADRVIRGDFKLQKTTNGGKRLANVKFSITSTATGESHTFTTDANGMYDSSSAFNKHSVNTNGGGADDGLWFGQYTAPDGSTQTVAVNDDYGAVVYDDEYVINELRCPANEGLALITGIRFKVSRDGYVVNLGTFDDAEQGIETTALDEKTGTHYALAKGEVTIVDTVSYFGLEKGKEYTLKAVPMLKSTGKALTDANGNDIQVTKTFTPKFSEGTVKIEVSFPADALAGDDVVMFEEVYLGTDITGIPVCEHKDIDDGEQTVHFPKVTTSLVDGKTNQNLTNAEKDVTLIDTVKYENLQAGKTYEVISTMKDQKTGETVKDALGNAVTGKTTFQAEKSDGIVDVKMTFDGSNLTGQTLVAFEQITFNNQVIAAEEDLENTAQTTFVPKVATTLTDAETGSKNTNADENATVTDTVVYSNLIQGKTYTVTGVLMLKGTKESLKDANGKEVTAEKIFTADKAEGSVELTFTFDASLLQGETIVAFERLLTNGIEVATHCDIEDEDQSTYVPEIGTKCTDKSDGDQKLKEGETVTIVDEVMYKNLIPGKTYKVTGKLMDKETGKVLKIDGKEVTGETEFTPEKADGSAKVTFTIDTTGLSGKKLVAFEKVYLVSAELGDVEVGKHEDIDDKEQTVKVTKTGKDNPVVKKVQTGIESHGGLYLMLALLCGAGAVVCSRKKKV